jgi:hypothetical protein
MGHQLQVNREGRLATMRLFGETSVDEQRKGLDSAHGQA